MKVLVVMALFAAVIGVGVHYGKDAVEAAIDHGIDTTLPTDVESHPWAPIRGGRPVPAARVRFYGGQVLTVRCRASLGGYTLHIDHRFTFRPTPTRLKAGCPGSGLRGALRHATRARVETHGRGERLVLTDSDGHVVATLQG
jgi:hypothetical protein